MRPARKAPVPKKKQTAKGSGKAAATKATTAPAAKRRKTKADKAVNVAAQDGDYQPTKAATATKPKATLSKPAQRRQGPSPLGKGNMDARSPLTPDESPFHSPQGAHLASPYQSQSADHQQYYLAQRQDHAQYGHQARQYHAAEMQTSPQMPLQSQTGLYQASPPQQPLNQPSVQQAPREHPLRGNPNIGPADTRAWLLDQALRSQYKDMPDLKSLGGHMNTDHVDAIASTMWEMAAVSANGQGDMLWRAAAYCANFSELKLRTLAHMNVLPAWWLFREYVVGIFRAHPRWTVDDSAKEALWNEALDEARALMIRRMNVIAGMKQEGEHQGVKQEPAMVQDQGVKSEQCSSGMGQ